MYFYILHLQASLSRWYNELVYIYGLFSSSHPKVRRNDSPTTGHDLTGERRM